MQALICHASLHKFDNTPGVLGDACKVDCRLGGHKGVGRKRRQTVTERKLDGAAGLVRLPRVQGGARLHVPQAHARVTRAGEQSGAVPCVRCEASQRWVSTYSLCRRSILCRCARQRCQAVCRRLKTRCMACDPGGLCDTCKHTRHLVETTFAQVMSRSPSRLYLRASSLFVQCRVCNQMHAMLRSRSCSNAPDLREGAFMPLQQKRTHVAASRCYVESCADVVCSEMAVLQ